MSEIKNRSEIVFLYDIKDANPNGDPMDENKPRIDEETEINIVTDVRLKRTIRDYLHNFKEKEIFVRTIEYEPGKIQDAKMRIEDFLVDEKGEKKDKKDLPLGEMKKTMRENVIKNCIDVRLFGATIPVEKTEKEKSSITLIGPVQFRFGRSLHKVEVVHIKGTGAFASEKEKAQKTFRDEYILPYSLICFYGIINENAAKTTELTEDDVNLLLDGIWNGTKNLITRSKIGQLPRLLLRVIYKEKNYHIGYIDKKIRLITDKDEKEIRDISEVKLDITDLINTLKINKEKIEKIEYEVNEDVVFFVEGVEIKGSEIEENLKKEGFQASPLNLNM
ncbi:MAG: type I-B CRISPR-associated protein Cas7/Csh2 [Candidatus Freyarchaeum deiterrae]